MTVRELMELLAQTDPELPVVVRGDYEYETENAEVSEAGPVEPDVTWSGYAVPYFSCEGKMVVGKTFRLTR